MNSLINNLDKIHTTKMGYERIKNNLKLNDIDIITYCKNIILNNNCLITRKGKNWYCKTNNIIITINASSYTIITAHKIKGGL